MRVTTDFWVSAAIRRVFSAGGFAAVSRRGASEAGAVMIVRRDRFGGMALYAPAPQTSYDESRPDERLFAEILRTEDEDAVRQRLERETRFDPDVWVVELEIDDRLFAELVTLAA